MKFMTLSWLIQNCFCKGYIIKSGVLCSLTITLNVNHTVDADFTEETSQKSEKEAAEMRSRPNFEIDIKKGSQTLTFSCSYLQEPPAEEVQQQEEYRKCRKFCWRQFLSFIPRLGNISTWSICFTGFRGCICHRGNRSVRRRVGWTSLRCRWRHIGRGESR
jgi:hypothetical protein